MNANVKTEAGELAELVAIHLQDEEAVLAAALPMVRHLKETLTQVTVQALPELVERHRSAADLLGDIKARRERFREVLARRLACDVESATVSRVIDMLPSNAQRELRGRVARIRGLAEEFVVINRWLTLHLRIHLDAYQRLLCDLTGSTRSSGRYGAAGRTEVSDYRPLIQVRG